MVHVRDTKRPRSFGLLPRAPAVLLLEELRPPTLHERFVGRSIRPDALLAPATVAVVRVLREVPTGRDRAGEGLQLQSLLDVTALPVVTDLIHHGVVVHAYGLGGPQGSVCEDLAL